MHYLYRLSRDDRIRAMVNYSGPLYKASDDILNELGLKDLNTVATKQYAIISQAEYERLYGISRAYVVGPSAELINIEYHKFIVERVRKVEKSDTLDDNDWFENQTYPIIIYMIDDLSLFEKI